MQCDCSSWFEPWPANESDESHMYIARLRSAWDVISYHSWGYAPTSRISNICSASHEQRQELLALYRDRNFPSVNCISPSSSYFVFVFSVARAILSSLHMWLRNRCCVLWVCTVKYLKGAEQSSRAILSLYYFYYCYYFFNFLNSSSSSLQNLFSILFHCSKMNGTRREFLRKILYNNIAKIAIQHSKMYFVDTFGDFHHTVKWNSLQSIWKISLYVLASTFHVKGSNYHTVW